MENATPQSLDYSKKNLENYARAYIGGYLNAVEKERPDHLPLLARSAPHRIDVCVMPNRCLCMIFERSGKEVVVAEDRAWAYVEEKVKSGLAHLVAVYPHEGVTVADAIARGKRDAIRDVKALEESHITRAVSQLEKTLSELSTMDKGNQGIRKLAEKELVKLQPVRDAMLNAGPEVDMLALLDALKNYPVAPVETGVDFKEKRLLEDITKDIGDLTDLVARTEAQDRKIAELEESLRKVLVEFNQSVEERISKGLAIILSSSDRKIDKGLAALDSPDKKEERSGAVLDLQARIEKLEKGASELAESPEGVSEELVLAMAEVRENVRRLSTRITKIEQYLSATARTRTLKQHER